MRTLGLICAATLAGAALPASSLAEDVQRDPMRDTGHGPSHVFGEAGQLALSSDVALLIQHSSQDSTTIQFAPAADFFLAHNVSVGGTLAIDYTQAKDTNSTRFGIGPRVGYNLAFTDSLGIWPKLGFSYSHTNVSVSVPQGGGQEVTTSTSGDHFTLNLFAPIMFHPVTHFFVGFGPFLDTDLSGNNKTTTFGGRLTLGGWLSV